MPHFDEQPVELQVYIYNCIVAASFTLLYYDYALTLPNEIELYWSKERRTFSLSSVLFFMNRYITLLGHVPIIFLYLGGGAHMDRLYTCIWVNQYNEYIIIVIQVIIGAMLIYRTYVLYHLNVKVLAVLCSVTVGSVIYGMVSILKLRQCVYTVQDLPPSGFLLPVPFPMAGGIAETWMALLAFDSLVFGLTLYPVFKTRKTGIIAPVRVIMRDGAMYYGIMILGSISVIVSFYVLPSYIRGLTATMTNLLSSTMMSRLMINLRGTEEIQDVSSNNYSIGIVFAKSLSSTLDEGSYSEDHDGLDDHRDDYYANSLPVHLKLCLPDLNCDERCTREVLKAMGIDVREIV